MAKPILIVKLPEMSDKEREKISTNVKEITANDYLCFVIAEPNTEKIMFEIISERPPDNIYVDLSGFKREVVSQFLARHIKRGKEA